jgi:hypothetical protein
MAVLHAHRSGEPVTGKQRVFGGTEHVLIVAETVPRLRIVA